MGDEISEEQLLEFCQRLGLAKNGYLDEKDLAVVCKCIGVEVPAEKIKELFEELDGDKDGKICLAELSQMFRGMQNKMPSTPERTKYKNDCQGSACTNSNTNGSFALNSEEKAALVALDPESTGFTKVGAVIDLWSQLGITQENCLHILKEMGFQACSRSNSINLKTLTKAIEDELDQFTEGGQNIPITIQIALLTYRTEAQYLRSLCEGVENERDKLKQDIFEAHQRSTLLAQEIDEQNARLEKTNLALIQKMESKCNDQIQDIQRTYAAEKECLQLTIQSLESKHKLLRDEEARLKTQVARLTQENSNLEHEVKILNEDVRMINRRKGQLEREALRFSDLEKRVIEMEKRNFETVETNERELYEARSEVNTLRDQNDELSVRLAGMKEKLHAMKAKEEKRHYFKRRKGNLPNSDEASFRQNDHSPDDLHGLPLEKIGKYIQENLDVNMLGAEEEADSFNCPQSDQPSLSQLSNTISISACVGESSTDLMSRTSPKSESGIYEFGAVPHYKSIESEMDSVKQRIVTIITKKDQLLIENDILRNRKDRGHVTELADICDKKLESSDASTQTQDEVTSSEESSRALALANSVCELEAKLQSANASLMKEQEKSETLEKSLELLQAEYEKCEDYWQGKLEEARDEYEIDRNSSDEKFHELAVKIQEYEDVFLNQSDAIAEKLPPIAEFASLERQVNDLEEECLVLRNELASAKFYHDATVESFQNKFDAKSVEDYGNLEQQVSALTEKCREYESRLSTLAEEERINSEDTGIISMLKDRVYQLESQIEAQTKKQNDSSFNPARHALKQNSYCSVDLKAPVELFQHPTDILPHAANSKSLLQMLNQSNSAENQSSRSASLPYFSTEPSMYQGVPLDPVIGYNTSAAPYSNDIWSVQPTLPTIASKKAWCHVELGWLQALRSKLKQRDEQCFALQHSLHQKDFQTEIFVKALKEQHASEISNWESLLNANQELNRQNVSKCREQAEKLAHANLLLKDLWVENAKLVAALNTTEQRVIQLENLLKFQMNALGKGQTSGNTNSGQSKSNQHSLPYTHHFGNN